MLSADVWQVVTDLLIDFLFYCLTLTWSILIKSEDSHLIFHKTSLSVPVLSRETLLTFLKHEIISVGHCDGVDVKPTSSPLSTHHVKCVCVSISLRHWGLQEISIDLWSRYFRLCILLLWISKIYLWWWWFITKWAL